LIISFVDSDFWLPLRPDTSINQKQTKLKMKKLFTLLFVAGALAIVSCGPSQAEKDKMAADAKAKMDSLFNAASTTVSTTMPDSTAKAATPDSTAKAK
jgi:hypothetical protein